ncbi:hypothetical protein A2U01_0117208, partial [Trifolium medium]|nr:hypothetical protein [Trifolium medium]
MRKARRCARAREEGELVGDKRKRSLRNRRAK